MLTKEELSVIQQSYKDAIDVSLDSPEFTWVLVLSDLFDVSADEVILNKLDEEMTEDEYREWGPQNAEFTILSHYINHGAIYSYTDSEGNLVIEPDTNASIPSFQLHKENKTIFSQEKRKFVLNLLHERLEKRVISPNELLEQLGLTTN